MMKLSPFLITALLSPSAILAEGDATFSYDPESPVGPSNWEDVEYADGTENQCGGLKNSPISIEQKECGMYADYELNGGTCTVKDFGFEINHHAEQVNAPDPDICETNTLKIPGVEGEFEMVQFHIHTGSEHTLDGKYFGGELHIVHNEIGGERVAVIGFFLLPTALQSNPVFDIILNEFDQIQDETSKLCNQTAIPHWWRAHSKNTTDSSGEILNPYELVPDDATFYSYSGGLTTPPCSEVVEWSMVDKPVEITVAQYMDLVSLTLNYVNPETCEFATIADPATGLTSRPVQDLNGRDVNRICPVGYVDPDEDKTDAESGSQAFQISHFNVLVAMASFLVLALM